MLDHHKALINAEMAAEKVVAQSQTFLPVKFDDARENRMGSATLTPQVMAPLCLVSTFLEDGLRMLSQWSEQQNYVNQVLSFSCYQF